MNPVDDTTGKTPLLTTKIHVPPARSTWVARPRLIDRLSSGINRKLTVLSAPAGFGKTSLVSEWVEALRTPQSGTAPRIAWYSIDDGDNDVGRFLSYLITSLQSAVHDTEAPPGGHGLELLHSSQAPPADVILTSLLNDLAGLETRVVIILDDYHLVHLEPIHAALAFLTDHAPPLLHVVIATREDPPLPLARMRGRGEVNEVRASDLRFADEEAAEYLNRIMELNLAAKDVAALQMQTEGWAVGLHMAAITLRAHDDPGSLISSFSGSNRFVLDFLMEEVLGRLSEDQIQFMKQTSVLDRMCGDLCDAVTGNDDGAETLDAMDRANLFVVPLDDGRRWYRYHHLFADLLRQRFQTGDKEQMPVLQQRASEWHENHGHADEAIEYALRAGGYEDAVRMLEARVDSLWSHGEHTRLSRWVSALPQELLRSHPALSIVNAWTLFQGGRYAEAEKMLEAAELSAKSAPDEDTIAGRSAAIRTFISSHRGHLDEIVTKGKQALSLLPQSDAPWRGGVAAALGDAHAIQGEIAIAYEVRRQALAAAVAAGDLYMGLAINAKLAVNARQQGNLHETVRICSEQLSIAEAKGVSHSAVAGGLLSAWGEVLAELGDLDGALDRATRGVEIARSGGDVAMLVWSHLCLIRVLLSRGDPGAAGEVLRETETISAQHELPAALQWLTAVWRARIQLSAGNPELFSGWEHDRALDPHGEIPFLREAEYVILARIFLVRGSHAQARELLERLLEASEQTGHTARTIELLILLARALDAAGDTARALDLIGRAVRLAEPRGFVRIFVDEGPAVGRLLYAAETQAVAPAFVGRLLAAFPAGEREAPESPLPPTESALPEPLSDREMEVLRLLAEGLTNRELGERLFISTHTIKAHTRTIYAKLDAHSRFEAVARARALGLLDLR